MKVRSEIVGGLVTGVYLMCVAALVYWKRATIPSLGLNEIGDFLAGVFGPVAFLWLVLGYIQQGRELKLSSEALQLQAAELKNSVDQQKEMVGIAGRQLEAELEKIIYERELRAKSLLPKFNFSAGVPSAGENLRVDFKVENFGGLAENISGFINDSILFEIAALASEASYVFRGQLPREDANHSFRLEYDYGDGFKKTEAYILKVSVTKPGAGIASIYFVPSNDS